MMSAAQIHQQASEWCKERRSDDPPTIEDVYFFTVSFEMILLSVEQSLRLLLLLNFSIVRPIHNIHKLYKIMQNKSGYSTRVRNDVVASTNAISKLIAKARKNDVDTISERDLVACLRKHDSSYSHFRYFGLDEYARASREDWSLTEYDVNIMRCLALALISINMESMRKRGIGMPAIRPVQESEITDDLREFINKEGLEIG